MKLVEYAQWAKAEKIVVEICTVPDSLNHRHDFLELSYVLDGSANHTIDGISTVLSKGDYFIVDYNKRHRYVQIGETPFTVINCLFVPQLIDETLSGCRQLKEVVNHYLIKFDFRRLKGHPSDYIYHDVTGAMGELFQKLCEEHEKKHMGYLEKMRCYLILILIDIMRQLELPASVQSDNEMVSHIVDYVQRNFMEKISLKEIAKEYNYSLTHVSRSFKAEIGMTFQDYVQSVRIQESLRLLMNTSKKISEIATLVGYTDIKFFNDVFKRHMGVSPRQFKKTYTVKSSETS